MHVSATLYPLPCPGLGWWPSLSLPSLSHYALPHPFTTVTLPFWPYSQHLAGPSLHRCSLKHGSVNDLSGPPVSVSGSSCPPEGSAQGSPLFLPTLSLALSQRPVYCRISPSLAHVTLFSNNRGDFPCKWALHKGPSKAFTPSPRLFPSSSHHSIHLSPPLLSLPFVCLPRPSLSVSVLTGPVGLLPSVAHISPPHPSSRSIFTELSGPQLPLSFPSAICVQLSPPLSIPN